jgi:hypothetical protein
MGSGLDVGYKAVVMTEHDSPTTPGTIEAAPGGDDEHDRDTIPAPEPVRSEVQSSDNAPTPAAPMRMTAGAGSAGEDLETLRDSEIETLRDSDIDTLRPPPPDGVIASSSTAATDTKVATATAAAAPSSPDVSSLAPRELSQRPAPPPPAQQRTVGLVIAAVLFGIGALVLLRQHSATNEPRAAASGAPVETLPAVPSAAAPLDEPLAAPSAPAVPAAVPVPEPGVGAEGTPPAAQTQTLAATAERAGATGANARRRAGRARAAQIAPAGDLPETPDREMIGAALSDLRAAFELCSDGRSGVAELDLTIRGSGSLAHAVVGGDFAGTPQGSCIARTLRKASFAPFQKPKFRVLYRLML